MLFYFMVGCAEIDQQAVLRPTDTEAQELHVRVDGVMVRGCHPCRGGEEVEFRFRWCRSALLNHRLIAGMPLASDVRRPLMEALWLTHAAKLSLPETGLEKRLVTTKTFCRECGQTTWHQIVASLNRREIEVEEDPPVPDISGPV